MAKIANIRGLKASDTGRGSVGECCFVPRFRPDHRPFGCALQAYIQDIRNCSTKEQEKERVDKELGKIRKKYTSDKAMTGACAPGRGLANGGGGG